MSKPVVGKWGLWKFYQGARFHMTLTPLNHATTDRYHACEANGGHKANGKTVLRDIEGRLYELKVCRKCKVPFGGPRVGRSAVRMSNARGGRT